MTNRPEGHRPTRNERRAAAQARAQKARTRQKRRQRGWRIGLQAGIVVVLIAAAAVVTLVLVNSVQPAGPGPDNMADGGITIGRDLESVGGRGASDAPAASSSAGSDTVRISLYVDYLCPFCGRFEQQNSAYIEGLLRSGAATIDIHPIAILSNRSQGTKYSIRAANAAACVADRSPDAFFAVNRALFAEQPEEGTPGLTNAQLTKLVTGVEGVRDTGAISRCIDEQTFSRWVDERTSDVTENGVPGTEATSFTGTPLVLVDGKRYAFTQSSTNEDFRTFVVTAAGSSFTEDTATPTPTPGASRSSTPSASEAPAASETPAAG